MKELLNAQKTRALEAKEVLMEACPRCQVRGCMHYKPHMRLKMPITHVSIIYDMFNNIYRSLTLSKRENNFEPFLYTGLYTLQYSLKGFL